MNNTTVLLEGEEKTAEFASDFAKELKAGDVIELIGDVGSGKTFFVRSLAKALGADGVSSPSFVIKNEYTSGKIPIMHYDFYRLDDPGIMHAEINESLSSDNLVIVEWAGNVKDVLPQDRYKIQFRVTAEDTRELTIVK